MTSATLAALMALAGATVGCESSQPAATRPAGGWIAFVNAVPGESGGIFVMNPDGTGARRISTATGLGLDWSPDGQQLAFTSNPGISVMNIDGAAATILSEVGEEPAWSPDGTQIAFAIRPNEPQGNDPPTEEQINRAKQMHVYRMQADGSGLVALTSGTVDDEWPSWSADGRLIAFERNPLAMIDPEGCGSGVCVMRADGTGPMAVAATGRHPSWAPDGDELAYASSSTDSMGIWVTGPNGAAARNLVLELAAGPLADFAHPAWSPDGLRLVFAYRAIAPRELVDIYVVDRDGSNLTLLASDIGNVWGLSWR